MQQLFPFSCREWAVKQQAAVIDNLDLCEEEGHALFPSLPFPRAVQFIFQCRTQARKPNQIKDIFTCVHSNDDEVLGRIRGTPLNLRFSPLKKAGNLPKCRPKKIHHLCITGPNRLARTNPRLRGNYVSMTSCA